MFKVVESLVDESRQRLFPNRPFNSLPTAFSKAAIVIKRSARLKMKEGAALIDVLCDVAYQPVQSTEEEVAFYERHIRLVFREALEAKHGRVAQPVRAPAL